MWVSGCSGNTFSHVDATGAALTGTGFELSSSSNNLLDKCAVAARGTGVRIHGGSADNRVECSNIMDNSAGMNISEPATDTVITGCRIEGNASYGVSTTTSQTVIAEHNWWGAADGPEPGGSGDLVIGNVDRDPYHSALLARDSACGFVLDSDNDGLLDTDENTRGTNPNDPDTDDDGLMDGTEVDIAMNSGCPDPLNADSDGDTLLDGAEVDAGTNPCNADTDGDGVPDNEDPTPTDPGVPPEYLQEQLCNLADEILNLSLALFNGPNENANEGRRNMFAGLVRNACNEVGNGNFNSAIAHLNTVLARVDDEEPPPDWMYNSPEKTDLADELRLLISLME